MRTPSHRAPPAATPDTSYETIISEVEWSMSGPWREGIDSHAGSHGKWGKSVTVFSAAGEVEHRLTGTVAKSWSKVQQRTNAGKSDQADIEYLARVQSWWEFDFRERQRHSQADIQRRDRPKGHVRSVFYWLFMESEGRRLWLGRGRVNTLTSAVFLRPGV